MPVEEIESKGMKFTLFYYSPQGKTTPEGDKNATKRVYTQEEIIEYSEHPLFLR